MIQLRDNLDELVEELRELNNRLANRKSNTTVNNTFTDSRDISDEDQPGYFSTAANPLSLDTSGEWEKVEFGLIASVISVRFDADIDVAFQNPVRKSAAVIPLFAADNESPFVIGGDHSIDSSAVWVRKPSRTSNNPTVHIVAYR